MTFEEWWKENVDQIKMQYHMCFLDGSIAGSREMSSALIKDLEASDDPPST